MKKKLAESDLAAPIDTYFSERGFETYHEVLYMGFRADMVATLKLERTTLIVVCEFKTGLGLDLIEQAARWVRHGYAHRSFACVPYRRIRSTARITEQLCRYVGIGVIGVEGRGETNERIPSVLHRKAAPGLLGALTEAHKTGLRGGSAGGGYETPFRSTCRNLAAYVAKNPGVGIKELVARIDHHYHRDSTATQCLRKWAQLGRIAGVRVEMEKGRCAFYPEEPKEPTP